MLLSDDLNAFWCVRYQRTCEVNRMGENSSFIFTCCVKTVPVYDFKLVWAVLDPSFKEYFKPLTDKSKLAMFYSQSRCG